MDRARMARALLRRANRPAKARWADDEIATDGFGSAARARLSRIESGVVCDVVEGRIGSGQASYSVPFHLPTTRRI
jgi:hypothetical protein